MTTPTAARALLDQYWQVRFRNVGEARAIAESALALCTGPDKLLDETWARCCILIADAVRSPNAAQLPAYDAIQAQFEALGENAGLLLVYAQRSILLWHLGRSAEATDLLEHHVRPHMQHMAPMHRYTAYVALLCVAAGNSDNVATLRYSYESLALARQIDDPGIISLSLRNIADAHLNYGNFVEARACLREVISLADTYNLYNRQRNALPLLARACIALGEHAEAEAAIQRWMQRFGDEALEFQILEGYHTAIHIAGRDASQWPQAEQWIDKVEAEVAARRASGRLASIEPYLVYLAWAKGHLRRRQGRYAEAIEALHSADEVLEKCDSLWLLMDVHHEIYLCRSAMNDLAGALAAHIEFARRQAILLNSTKIFELMVLANQHAVDAERLGRQKAEETARLKSEFLANMSHEIRTPMNAIIGLAHLSLRGELPPKQRDYISKIQSSALSLLGIINEILDFSKIEAGKLQIESVPFSLDEVLAHIETVTGQKASEKGLAFTLALPPELPRTLVGDPMRLGQVLVNLVNNAVKFTERGEVKLAVQIAGQEPDAIRLAFSVHDTGIGMTPTQVDKLFEAFTQADGSTTRKYGGTGLGLSISRRLLQLMGGDIRVDSVYGQGSVFRFTLRFGATAEVQATRGDRGAAPTGHAVRGRRVLVVEDNEINRQIAEEMLTSAGIYVEMAASGLDALDKLMAPNCPPYDAILMDLQMPDLDGHATTAAIRRDRRFDGVPIIAMTAHATADVRQRCLSEGMQDHLGKPIEPEKLFDVLQQWFSKRPAPSVASPAVNGSGGVTQTGTPKARLPDPRGFDFARLTELDHVFGLHCMAGKRDLYLSVLQRVRQRHHNTPDTLINLLLHGQYAEAEALVHTLKGLAGSIGAKRVATDAEAMEAALMAQREQEQANIDLAQFHAPLGRSLTALLQQLDAELPADSPVAAPTQRALDPAAMAVFKRLQHLLSIASHEASHYFISQRTMLQRIFDEATLSRLEQHICQAEFTAAVALLAETR